LIKLATREGEMMAMQGSAHEGSAHDAVGPDRTTRLLAAGGVAGPIIFVALVVVGGFLYDGYSHVSQAISELGGEGAEYAALQNFNFIMVGVLVIGFAWGLARGRAASLLGAALVGFFGLSSSIANGLLPCDLGCEGTTTVGLLHNITGIAGFLAAIAGMFVLERQWRTNPGWRGHAVLTRRAAFLALAGLVGFIVTKAAELESIDGLLQRVFVVVLLAWIALTAARLYRDVSGVVSGERGVESSGRPA
jgi:hypothetical membrane protein